MSIEMMKKAQNISDKHIEALIENILSINTITLANPSNLTLESLDI